MSVLVLQCIAPLQAWGSKGAYYLRQCDNYPTKSGVIGMIAGALGRKRDADISDLCALRMGVRVDQAGTVFTDYQTVKRVEIIGKKKPTGYVVKKEYLADAKFTIYLEHESKSFLQDIADALNKPFYPVYFGRRNCIPSENVVLNIVDDDIISVMKNTEFIGDITILKGKNELSVQAYLEGIVLKEEKFSEKPLVARDYPISFDQSKKTRKPRRYYALKNIVLNLGGKKASCDFFTDIP